MTAPAAAFDSAFRARAPRLHCRPERPDDQAFLTRQFIACSPMAAVLPPAMLKQQAALHFAAHNHAHPSAMRRIAMAGSQPIGRFMIDWTRDNGHGVDLAVLPEFRATGAGLHFLRAWLAVCDATGRTATLEVMGENPAALLYRRLGFISRGGRPGGGPVTAMIRPASVASTVPAAAQE